MIDREFCQALKIIREKQGLTQSTLESRCGFPASLISHYENGTRSPGLANIKALIRGLNCSANDLLGGAKS